MEGLVYLSVAVSIILLCLFIKLWIYVAKQFAAAANEKGHYGKQYFHLCFWLGIVGCLLVIALPDRRPTVGSPVQSESTKNDELPEL